MDDGSPAGYIVLIVLLLFGGGYFAGTEIAFASVNRIRMMSYADDGNKQAKRVLYVLDHFDKALTTLLIGNNIMHIGCASVATLLASKLWGSAAVTAATFVTTLVVFFVAEMIPKAYAKACSEKFALSVSGSLIFLMRALSPVSFVFSKLGELVKKPFAAEEAEEPTVTEDELHDIIETIGDDGELDKGTTELVQSALKFTDRTLADIVTPLSAVTSVSRGMSVKSVMEVINATHFSRLPVTGAGGEICGILQIRKFLKEYLLKGDETRMTRLMDHPFRIDGSLPIDDVLGRLSAKKIHMAVVTGADGKTLGIVTVEDIIEELVGEIYDEEDPEVHGHA